MKLSDSTVFAVVLQKDQEGKPIMQVQFADPEGSNGAVVFRDFDYSDFLERVKKHFNDEE